MKRKIPLIIILMSILFIKFGVDDRSFSYAGSDCIDIVNPARGLYIQVDSSNTERVREYAGQVSLVQVTFNIYDYRNSEIAEDKLQELQDMLEMLRVCGMKGIIRPAYGFVKYKSNDASSLEIVQMHIDQIVPILNKYERQVYCVQVGFFGPWGEWHSSKYIDGDDGEKNRIWLVSQLIRQLDEDIPVCLRRPSYIREALEAGCPVERIGYFNDGLLGSDTDLGTYEESKRDEEILWVNENITAPCGGEMPGANEFSDSQNANREFDIINVSYLNMDYNEAVFDAWETEEIDGVNAADYITKHLGYRFMVDEIVYPERVKNGFFRPDQMVKLSIYNDGYAAISDDYRFIWILEDAKGKIKYKPSDELISDTGTGQTFTGSLNPVNLTEDVRRVGFIICNPSDNSTARAVNSNIICHDGIHYVLEIDEDGNVEALHR